MKTTVIKTFTVGLMIASATQAMAQQEKEDVEFVPHWYIGLYGGAQHTLGEAKFNDLISPNIQVGIGYQVNPWFGLRLAANAWQSKGGWNAYKLTPQSTPVTAIYKYKYVAPGVDAMFNLSNALFGYNPNRVLNVSAFIGAGANIAWSNSEANNLAAAGYDLRYNWTGTKVLPVGRGGVAVDFRINDRLSIGLEGNANILSDKYNSKKANNADWYFNALAGIKINLGKASRKRVVETPAPEPQRPQPAPKKEEPQPAPVEEKKVEAMQRDVFFKINSNVISAAEETKVKELADYLKENTNAQVTVTGYADAGTGNDRINDRISARRAASVKAMLIEKYGISADRITTDSKGSHVQPFAENDKNRVSICVAE